MYCGVRFTFESLQRCFHPLPVDAHAPGLPRLNDVLAVTRLHKGLGEQSHLLLRLGQVGGQGGVVFIGRLGALAGEALPLCSP